LKDDYEGVAVLAIALGLQRLSSPLDEALTSDKPLTG
jgi:hypothetical protein